MALTLDTLKFGDLNIVKENDDNHAGDRRRTSPLTALRFATEKAFEKDTLIGVSEFVGVVVGKRQIDFATHEYQGTLINTSLLPKPQPGGSRPRSTSNWLYRVYIPELEPLPAPKSYSDPVLLAYKEIPIDLAMAGTNLKLNEGDVVRVRYQDANNLFGPKIIKKVMEATPEWEVQPVGNAPRLRVQPSRESTENNSHEPGPPYSPSTTPTTPGTARTSPGTNGSNVGIIYKSTGQRVYNGKLKEANIPLAKIKIKNSSNRMGTYELASPAIIDDLRRMMEAFNLAFNGTKFAGANEFLMYAGAGSAYRTWGNSGRLRNRNCTGPKDRNGFNTKPCSPDTAKAGTSRHGWALAIDLATARMMGTVFDSGIRARRWHSQVMQASDANGKIQYYKPSRSRKKFKETYAGRYKEVVERLMRAQSIKWRWLNRYGRDFNFVFTVYSEAWHMESLRYSEIYRAGTGLSKKEREYMARGPKRPPSFCEGLDVLPIGPIEKPWEGAAPGFGPYGSVDPEKGILTVDQAIALNPNAPPLLD